MAPRVDYGTWVRLPDKLPDEPEVAALSDAAFRLHVTALCYCSRHLTDGEVPDSMISRWGVRGAQRAANELVESGLWRWVDGDWRIEGYLDLQRSRADAEALSVKRAEAGRKGGKARANEKQPSSKLLSKTEAEVEVEEEGERERDNYLSSVADATNPERPELLALCDRLADAIEANGSKRPTVSKAWLTSVRLLLDKDGRTPEQVAKAIDWCQADEFWRANILSMPKLRERYDQLRMAAQRTGKTRESERNRKARRLQELLAEQQRPRQQELQA